MQGLQRLDKRLRDIQQQQQQTGQFLSPPSLVREVGGGESRMEEANGSSEETFLSAMTTFSLAPRDPQEIPDPSSSGPDNAPNLDPALPANSVNKPKNAGPDPGGERRGIISSPEDELQTLNFHRVNGDSASCNTSNPCANQTVIQYSAKSNALNLQKEEPACNYSTRKEVSMLESVFESDSEEEYGTSCSSRTHRVGQARQRTGNGAESRNGSAPTRTNKQTITNQTNGIPPTEATAAATRNLEFSKLLLQLNHNHANERDEVSSDSDNAVPKSVPSKSFINSNNQSNETRGKITVAENSQPLGPAADDDSEYSGSDSENEDPSDDEPVVLSIKRGKKLSLDSAETEKGDGSGPSSPKRARTDSSDFEDERIYVGAATECGRTSVPPLLMPEVSTKVSPSSTQNPSDRSESSPPNLEKCGAQQFCMFCPATFTENSKFAEHLVQCNETTAAIADFQRKICLVCNRKIINFNVTGLFRHSFQCVVLDRTRLVNDQEASAEDNVQSTVGSSRRKHDSNNDNNNWKRKTANPKTKADAATVYDTYEYQESGGTVDRSSGHRGQFTDQQTAVLRHAFNAGLHYLSSANSYSLANKTGLSRQQVKQWFARMRFQLKITKKTVVSDPQDNVNTVQLSEKSRNAAYPGQFYKRLVRFASENQLRSPNIEERLELAQEIDLTEKQIRDWFQNMRRPKNIDRFRTMVQEYEQEEVAKDSHSASADEDENDSEEDPANPNFSMNFEDLPEVKKQQVLNAFDRDPHPPLLDILALADEIGFERSKLFNWFEKQRKTKGLVEEPSNGEEACSDAEASDSDDSHSMNLKLMTTRQKLKMFKRIPKSFIAETLNDYRVVFTKVLLEFAQADPENQVAYESDCVHLVAALNERDPYEGVQKRCFTNWEDDWAVGLYPEHEGQDWILLVDRFKLSVLHVWSQVIVFQTFVKSSLTDAASAICGLRKIRGNDDSMQSTWAVAELIEEIRKSNIVGSKDCDDDLSGSSFCG